MVWTRNRWLAEVKKNPACLERMTEEFRDREMCLAAVKQDGEAFQYVPTEVRGDAATAEEFLAQFEEAEESGRPSM